MVVFKSLFVSMYPGYLKELHKFGYCDHRLKDRHVDKRSAVKRHVISKKTQNLGKMSENEASTKDDSGNLSRKSTKRSKLKVCKVAVRNVVADMSQHGGLDCCNQ